MKCITYRLDSMLSVSFTRRSPKSPYGLLQGVTVTCWESIQKNFKYSSVLLRDNLAKLIYGCVVLPKRIDWNDLKKGCFWLVRRIHVVGYCMESIFEYEYLCKYEAKIEISLTLV